MSEPLPEQTSDDTDVGWGERPSDEDDDQRLLERGMFVYDALYAWCRENVGNA